MNNTFRLVSALICIFYFSNSVAKENAKAPPLASYGKLPEVSMMEISPGGGLIAYRKTTDDVDALIVSSLHTNEIVYAVDVGKVKPREIDFVTDRRVIVRGSDTITYYGQKREFNVAYAIDLERKMIWKLMEPGGSLGVVQTGLGTIVGISPEQDMVYMPAYYGETEGVVINPNYSLLRVPIDRRMSPFVHETGSRHTRDYLVDKHGKVIVRALYNETSDVQQIFSRTDGGWKEIYSTKSEFGGLWIAGISADGKRLFVEEDVQDVNARGYKTLPLAGGELEGLHFHRKNESVEEVYTDIQRVLYGVRYSGFEQGYEFLDQALQQKIDSVVNGLPGNGVWLSSWTPDWKNIVMLVEGKLTPCAYVLFKDGEKPRKLVNCRPQINASSVMPMVTFDYSARDGLTIPTLLTLPSDDPKAISKLPTIILPHGGPASHDVIGFDWMAQFFASRGYLVVQPQFRGSDGFGERHRVAGYSEWGRKMQDDLTDAVQYLIKEGYANPDKICIVGASYGGYAALAGGAFTPDLYRCVVSIAGVSDLERSLQHKKWLYGSDSSIISHWSDLIGKETITDKQLHDLSPSNFATKFKAPVLLIHGSDDTVVPFSQSKIMFNTLKAAKKTVELEKLKGEDHWLSLTETRMQMLAAVSAFVDRHLIK